MRSKSEQAMSRWDWSVIGLTIAAILMVGHMKKSTKEVGAWGPKKQ